MRQALAAASAAVLASGASGVLAAPMAGETSLSTQSLSTSEFMSSAEFLGTEGMLDEVPLYLSVTLNGRDTGLIAEFMLHRDGRRMSSTREELDAVGLIPPRGLSRVVFLDAIPGVAYAYDEAAQAIAITAPYDVVKPQAISGTSSPDFTPPQPGYGAVLNYRLTTDFGSDVQAEGLSPKSAYVDLEGRIYAPFGVFTTTGAVSATGPEFADPQFTRYDSYFTYSSPRRMLTFTAGDFVTSTLPWGRSVRLGGVQLRRDFSLRDDVITSPRLSYDGVAAVPSTVDVYVGNVRAWSGKTEAGPFKLSDLPMISAQGEAVIVIRDEAGNEQVGRVPFFAGRDVLKAGMVQFSLDGGHPRGEFGGDGAEYGAPTVGAGSLRYGLTDRLTLMAQAESGMGLTALTVGATTILFNMAEVTFAAGASRVAETKGSTLYGTFRTEVAGIDVKLSSLRNSADYSDLATVVGLARQGADATAEDMARQHPAKAQDALTLGFNDIVKNGSLSLSFIHSERAEATNSILSASYSQRVGENGSVRVSAFNDFAEGGLGISLGFDMMLGERGYAGAGLSRGRDGALSSYASLSQPVRRELGSMGYRANLYGWHDGNPHGEWAGTYRSGLGQGEVRMRLDKDRKLGASASFDGSVVVAGGRLLAGNRIRDSFAVVKVGEPGIPVRLHSREVARTGLFGAALVPDLQAYRNNRVSIDAQDLPADATVAATAMTVVPAARSGVTVVFGEGQGKGALVILRGADGAVLPAGTPVKLRGSDEEYFVGYDGELWLEGLSRQNHLTATLDQGTCSATFAFKRAADGMTRIDGVVCE